MKFKEQAFAASKKANRVLGMIRRNFESMNMEIFQILYSTQVRPHLEYSATIWSPYHKSQKDTIDKVQQKATKLIPNLRKKKYNDRLKKLDLMSTEVRRKRENIITTFMILKGKFDLGRSIFQVNTENRTRGHNLKLVITEREQTIGNISSQIECARIEMILGGKWSNLHQQRSLKRPTIIGKIQREEADHRAYSSIPLNSMQYTS